MPTTKPRLAITLTEDTRAAVADLADALGKPESSVVSELLTEMAPQLRDLAKLQRAVASGRKSAAKQAMRDLMGTAMAEVMSVAQPELFEQKKRAKR